MKRYLGRILLCVIPVVIACIVVVWAGLQYAAGAGGFRLGVDLSGGTILVYEVDLSKMTDQARQDLTAHPEQLAASLKRRIDPADLYNATIRPLPGDPPRVEIILPTGGRIQAAAAHAAWQAVIDQVQAEYPDLDVFYKDIPEGQFTELINRIINAHPKYREGPDQGKDVPPEKISDFIHGLEKKTNERRAFTGEDVETIKNLIQQQGRLEFRILANDRDDHDAIEAAEKYIDNPANQGRLDELNTKGAPPLPPTQNGAENGDRFFPASVNGENLRCQYSWVEVGKEELYSLQLNSAAENTPDSDPARERRRQEIWAQAKQAIDKNPPQAFVLHPSEILLYRRKIADPGRILARDQELGKQYEWFVLTRETEHNHEVTGDFLTSTSEGASEGKRAVNFSFNSEGANRFLELTTQNRPTQQDPNNPESGFHRQLAVVLDNQVRSAPNLNSPIGANGQITGDFTPKEVEDLVRILRAGALPATLKPQPASVNTMGATLGEDTIFKGALSVLLAFAAVLLFMLVYYRFAGVVACIALMANLLLTVAFMVLVQATFTLPGLAGLVLMLGMAVDANVLIYERLREERERGASLALAVRNGYDRAFPTIIDTHLTSIFTAIVLYVVGNDQLKGFGISLTVGLIISLFTSLVMTRTMFDIWLGKNWLHKLYFMQLFKRPNLNFMKIRHIMFALTGGLTVAGAVLFVFHLFNGGLNIDFVGGTAYAGQLVHPVSLTELRERLEPDKHPLTDAAKAGLGVKADLPDLSIEQVFVNDPTLAQGDKSALFTVRSSEKDADLVQKIVNYKLGAEWGKIVGDKDDPGDLLKRIVMTDPVIHDTNGKIVTKEPGPDEQKEKAKVATLEFVKSTDDFATDDQVKGAVEKVRGVLEKDLAVSNLKIDADNSPALLTLHVGLPEGSNKKAADLKKALQKARDDLEEQGLETVDPTGPAFGAGAAGLPGALQGEGPLLVASALSSGITPDVETQDDLVRAVTLRFPRPQPDYASPAQVARLLAAELGKIDIHQFDLKPAPGAVGRQGRYSRMLLTLGESSAKDEKDAIDVPEFRAVLQKVQQEFSNTPQPERLEKFDSQLAADTQQKALYAILASWIAILLYLWFRFGSWTFGAATVVCLIHDLFFTLGAIALCHYIYLVWPGFLGIEDFKIDLPSVAALLTLVGYSVSDTIVVFDRIREVRGKNPLLTYTMINDSVNQTLSRTILSSLTVFLVVGVLYIFGGEGVHLFAFVMVVGVVVGTYSSIYIASPLLIMFGEGAPKTERAKVAAAEAAAAHA